MHFVGTALLHRLVAPAAVVAFIGCVVGCASSSPSTTGVASGAPSSEPSSSVPVAALNQVLPTAKPITAIATITLPYPSGSIPSTTDGTNLWIGETGSILRVDGRTGATTRLRAPGVLTDDSTLAIESDGLWLADHHGNRIQRLDPVTGKVEVQASAPGPVGFTVIGETLWVGSEPDHGLYPVDRTTGRLGKKIGSTFQVSAGSGAIWEGEPDGAIPATIMRLDPRTGTTTATIAVPRTTGCGVSGAFPDQVWAFCPLFAPSGGSSQAVRIDPANGKVVAAANLPPINSVVVVNGTPWFLVRDPTGGTVKNELLAVDPATGKVRAALDLGALDPDTPLFTSTGMWIRDETGGRVLEYSLASLTS